MAVTAGWWTLGRGRVRVRQRRTARVHCVACDSSLYAKDVSGGDELDCHACGETITIGVRQRQSVRRARVGLGVESMRVPRPLRVAAYVVLAGLLIAMVGEYLHDPEPFHLALDRIAGDAQSSWSRFRALVGRGPL